MRTAVKKFRAALSAGDLQTAKSLLPTTLALRRPDRPSSGAVPKGAADRQKSRLTLALNRLAAGR